MKRKIYISADYDDDSGDRNVVEELNRWADDNRYKIDFVDMAKVVSGSVCYDPDCRACDLKEEFNRQINASSVVILVVGDKTASRTAGSNCKRNIREQNQCTCTPYKHNVNGTQPCKVKSTTTAPKDGDVGCINRYSYLRHEYEQAVKKNKKLAVLYNATIKEPHWLPNYMKQCEDIARPFWTEIENGRIGNYDYIKQVLNID